MLTIRPAAESDFEAIRQLETSMVLADARYREARERLLAGASG